MTETKQPHPDNAIQSTSSSQKDRALKAGQAGNIEFERINKADLEAVPVIVQALDNQWLPRSLLEQAQKKGQVTGGIDRELRKAVRSEYIRSLINGQQVIINRAYLYNNPVISQDYTEKSSSEREAFKTLLEEGTIVPFLYSEETPVDRPEYELQEEIFALWQELCKEVRTHCIRLSWKNKENETLTRNELARRFHTFALSAAAGDVDTYLADLHLDPSAKNSLRQRLVEVGRLCLDASSQGKFVTRNILYKAFVTAGTNPSQRQFDNSPLAGSIKQLLDLSYNCNLPDALGGYLITPVDSLPRTALQEWQQAVMRPTITGKELLELLQRTAFDLVGRGLNVESMDVLRLQDVREIRKTEEWSVYIQSLESLLKQPEQFADGGAANVYQSYAKLASQLTGLIDRQKRKDSALTSWSPTIELVFNIAGAILTWRGSEAGPIWRLRGKVSDRVEGDTAPVVGKLIIRDISEEQPQQDLSTGVDFMRFMVPDVQEEWYRIEREVRKLPGFQEILTPSEEENVDPTMSFKEQVAA